MANVRIQFRPGEALANELRARAEIDPGTPEEIGDTMLNETARTALEEYYKLLKFSLPRFTLGEAMLMIDALNGTILSPETASLLWASISDAIELNQLDQKWDVDGEALVTRLRDLGRTNLFACWAIADAVNQAWKSPTYYVGDIEERARQVGLVREEKRMR